MKIFLSQALQFDNRSHELPIEDNVINNPLKVYQQILGFWVELQYEVTPEQKKENPILIAKSDKAFILIDVKLDPNNLENVQILDGQFILINLWIYFYKKDRTVFQSCLKFE